MKLLRFLCLGLLAAPLAAQDGLAPITLPMPSGFVTWTAGQGLEVRYQGQTVFLPSGAELVLHDPAWKVQYDNSPKHTPTARVEPRGGARVLTVEYGGEGLTGTQTVTVGPGDRFEVSWVYRQTGWDPAGLQLAFPRPAEGAFAGAAYEGLFGANRTRGVIPAVFDPQRRTPLAGFRELTVHSLAATVTMQSLKPLALYDYPQRHGAFWLGDDQPLPKGQEERAQLTVTLAPADVVKGGVRFRGMSVPNRVGDGLLNAELRLAQAPDGPKHVTVTGEVRQGDRVACRMAQAADLTAEPRPIVLTTPLLEPAVPPGEYQVVLAVVANGQEAVKLPAMPLSVRTPIAATPGRSFYTDETNGSLLVYYQPEVPATAKLTVEGAGQPITLAATPGKRQTVPLPLGGLPQGATTLQVRLSDGERVLALRPVVVRRLPDKPNAVKVDYASRTLIVDGLPMSPYGFYAQWPATQEAEEEAPFGLTHLAPYRGAASQITDDASRAAVLATLDRYAALGMKVHYDVRYLSQAAETPDTWNRLRAEVEAVRDHPALLCYYLADEPELQHIPPERMAKAYRLIQELDPYHPCTQVLAEPGHAAEYLAGMDILMSDPYPIPNAPVTRAADAAKVLDDAVGSALPVWIVTQAFGGGEWWAREPSPAEERVMTYLAWIHGATGIQPFIREPLYTRPLPLLLAACRELAGQAAELTPAFAAPEPRQMLTASGAVHAALWVNEDAAWILAANPVNQPQPLTLTLPDGIKAAGPVTVLFEDRTVTAADGKLTDLIEGFGTRAYRLPLKPEDPNEGIAKDNLVRNPGFEEQHVPGSPDGYYLSRRHDAGAQVRIDSRTHHQGRHSLRLVAPADGKGYSMSAYPVPLKAGQSYRVSLWARSLRPGAKLALGVSNFDTPAQTFTLTPEWQEYTLTGKAKKDERGGIGYELTTAGTAWIDQLQMVPAP